MQKDIENKALAPEAMVNKATEPEAAELPAPPLAAPAKSEATVTESWHFSGDGRKKPITIQASSLEVALEIYKTYLNS